MDGEVFQVVISRRFEMECGADPLDVYRVLRNTNPSPYMYLFSFEDADGREYSIVGLLAGGPRHRDRGGGHHPPHRRLTAARQDGGGGQGPGRGTAGGPEGTRRAPDAGGPVPQRPLQGLRRRIRRRHPVHGSGALQPHHAPGLHRGGRAGPGAKAYDVLKATFPAGTLSGAPKPRALRLLDELEPHRRGIYGGVVGYLDFAGDMDMAIAIRSALLREGRAYVQAGGGIVADSVNPTEAQETVNKAAAPLRAVHTAGSLHNITADAVTGSALTPEPSPARRHSEDTGGQPSRLGPQVHPGPGDRCPGPGRLRHHHPDLADRHLDPAQLGAAVASQDGLQVQGSKAATAVTALALVAFAGGLAASIAGRVARWIITAIILLAAAGIVAAAAVVLADPLAASQGSIAAATGVTGSSAKVDVTVFPVLAVVAGALLGISALLIVPPAATGSAAPNMTRQPPGPPPAGAVAACRPRRMRSTAGTGCPAGTTPPEPMAAAAARPSKRPPISPPKNGRM